MGAAFLETTPQQGGSLHVPGADSRLECNWTDSISASQPEDSGLVYPDYSSWWAWNDGVLSPPAFASHFQDEEDHRAYADFLRDIQRVGSAGELGGLSPAPSFQDGHSRRHLQPETGRILVGALAVALSVDTRGLPEVVPGADSRDVQTLDLGGGSDDRRLFAVRPGSGLAGIFLARCDPANVFTSHAVLRE